LTKLISPFASNSRVTAAQSDARVERREIATAQGAAMTNTRSRTIAAVIVVGALIALVAMW
jgi:hypothetical protein